VRNSRLFLLVVCFLFTAWLQTQAQQIRIAHGKDVVEVEAVSANIVRVHVEPVGISTPRTPVMDPALLPDTPSAARLEESVSSKTLTSAVMRVEVSDTSSLTLQIFDAQNKLLLSFDDLLAAVHNNKLSILQNVQEDLYGMRGLHITNKGDGILRTGGAQISETKIAAGTQGNGGAPFFFTRRYGVLVDSDGGSVLSNGKSITFQSPSRPDVEFFVLVGPPLKVMEGLARLVGRPEMPPKWTLGFLNSQWGSTEQEWRDITQTYKQKQIPISGYILDFDWKAWGEDNYGEWRWNSTSGPGNFSPNSFPNGASGLFAADMLKQGIHITGILKPRILVNNADGSPTKASRYATEHNFWYPNEVREDDYVTHRLAGNLDFANPEARRWFWEHLIPAFKAGVTGWWNDEADSTSKLIFNNFEHFNMARALYDGQRSTSDERVWSINRNYYLGASRYGYAEWSGDIDTGFPSMAYQRARMIAALDIGLQHWSMDTGGFRGKPTPENYARWVEFATFVPIDRVHGEHHVKRQPWVYGDVAEAAATKAIRLRYELLPYIYSNERVAADTGIGIVRPLFWEFPKDAKSATETRSWMFGDALLVSPIVEEGATTHALYLPPGDWINYQTGALVAGGKEIEVPADAVNWQDIPIFIRKGSILVLHPGKYGEDLSEKSSLIFDIFPSTERKAQFTLYDDDGHTYAYEKGEYFRQKISVEQSAKSIQVTIDPAEGSFKTAIQGYMLHFHCAECGDIQPAGGLVQFKTIEELQHSSAAGWVRLHDKYGPELLIHLPLPIKEGQTLSIQ